MKAEFIARLWRGEHDLHDTFWRYTILVGLAVNVVTSIGFMVLVTYEMPLVAALVGYGLSIPYNIFILIALWRSAGAYKGPSFTATFMRVTGIVWMAFLTLT